MSLEDPEFLKVSRQSRSSEHDVREYHIESPKDENDVFYTMDNMTSYHHYENDNNTAERDDDDDDDDDFLLYSSCPESGNDASNVDDNSSFRIGRKSTQKHDRGHCDLTTARQRGIIIGFLIGLFLGLIYICWTITNKHGDDIRTNRNNTDPDVVSHLYNQSAFYRPILFGADQTSGIIATIRRPLFIAVLTQEKFLTTRGTACNSTWARSSYVTRVEFFTEKNDSSTSQLRHGNSLTYLEGILSIV